MAHHLITASIAVLPALLAMWWGRHLEHITDDGGLSERLGANRAKNSFVTAACVTFIWAGSGTDWIWALAVLFVTRMSVGYVMRRRLYNERWSIVAYGSFFTRLVIAAFGFWILLGLMPWLEHLAGTRDWIAGGALAIALLALNNAHGLVFRKLLGARPVEDSVVTARFEQMVSACALRNVVLEQVDVRGGTFMNAVALPSTRWPAVVVTNTLMERLDVDEIVAILGHELAHLEHYTPRRLQRLNGMNYTLIVTGALIVPVARIVLPQALWGLMLFWQLVMFTVPVLRAKDRQANETASDLRALALSGNPDALVRALVKVHAAGRIGRRWDVEWERQATHPSLARRIQAIHAAAGMSPAKLGESATFADADGSSVTLHDDRIVWNEHGTASHVIPYNRLVMIRVDARSSKTPRLVALDVADRRWELTLSAGDVPRAQATLDIVDGHLGAAAAPPPVSLLLPQLIVITVVTASVSLQPWPTALIAALAAMVPALPVLGAAGAASIATAATSLRGNASWATDWQPYIASALFAAGVLLLIVNVANRRERMPKRTRAVVWMIAAGAIVSWSALALSVRSAIDLHNAFHDSPSLTVFALALGAALAFLPVRAARYASLVVIAAGFAAFMVGSTTFLDRFVDDPFLAHGQSLQVRSITSAPVSEFEVPFEVDRLLLSPAGGFVAVAAEDDDEVTTFHAGAFDGPLTTFDADDAFFVDEGRLLVLERQDSRSVLRLVDLEQNARSLWSRRINWSGSRMSFDRSSRSWRVFGWGPDEEDIVSVAGTLGSDNASEVHWKAPTQKNSYVEALAVSDRNLLALETIYSPPVSARARYRQLIWWVPQRQASYRLWTLGEHPESFGESHLAVRCPAVSPDGQSTLCTAYDGSRTGFFTVDPASHRLTPLATVSGRSYVYNDSGDGWMTGWWDGAPILIRPAQREAIRIAFRTGEQPSTLAISEAALGAVTSSEHGSTIHLYQLRY